MQFSSYFLYSNGNVHSGARRHAKDEPSRRMYVNGYVCVRKGKARRELVAHFDHSARTVDWGVIHTHPLAQALFRLRENVSPSALSHSFYDFTREIVKIHASHLIFPAVILGCALGGIWQHGIAKCFNVSDYTPGWAGGDGSLATGNINRPVCLSPCPPLGNRQ